jgi:PAS domain S-box-containing protein
LRLDLAIASVCRRARWLRKNGRGRGGANVLVDDDPDRTITAAVPGRAFYSRRRFDGPSILSHTRVVSGLQSFGGDLEGALERVNVPSYVLDANGIIRWVNPAARRRVGDVRGRQFTSVVAPDDRRRSRELFAQKLAGSGSVTDAEIALIDADGDRVVADVSSVPLYDGNRVIGIFGQVVHEEAEPAAPPHPALTGRQTEVLGLLARGLSTRQIASELHLSPETVRNHIRDLMGRLGVHTRLEAVAVWRHDHPGASS